MHKWSVGEHTKEKQTLISIYIFILAHQADNSVVCFLTDGEHTLAA